MRPQIEFLSRAPQGARGLKSKHSGRGSRCAAGRAPQGARGLKFKGKESRTYADLSRPARGAWVEIDSPEDLQDAITSRAPQGARGLKLPL